MEQYVEGVHLNRTGENAAEIDALAAVVGGRVGLGGVLGDLNRRGREVRTRPFWPPGRAVHRAFTWDHQDQRTLQWWPQGISTSADASDTGHVGGRGVFAVTWYAKDLGEGGQGSRVTFVDRETRRYRHVLLVVPRFARNGSLQVQPLRIHAGGVVWCGDHLHVAATFRGFMTFRLDDLMRIPDGSGTRDRLGVDGDRVSAYGYRYVLPVRFSYQSFAEEGHERLRYSFLSLDRSVSPPHLVAGEYASGEQGSRRLVHYPLDPESLLLHTGEDGISRPLRLEQKGVAHTQGVAVVDGRYYLSVSRGSTVCGSVYVGRPGAFRPFRRATPMGPEDLSWWRSTDELWSVTEHPRRRWLFSMKRSWFDR